MDSPLMRAMTIIADLFWLNVLTLICCIPIITAGASLTAMHYMALKIVRSEENHLTKSFFKAFKENFKQSTIIWLIILAVSVVLGVDIYIMITRLITFPMVVEVVIIVIAILALMTFAFVFPLQAKFANPVLRTFKNALIISLMQFPKTIAMIALNVAGVAMVFSVRLLPVAMFFGISGPAYAGAVMYNKFFKKLENRIQETNEEGTEASGEEAKDERIFHDELDESISENETSH